MRPYCSKARPHSLHTDDLRAAARPAVRRGRGRGCRCSFPRASRSFSALRLAARALLCAIIMARFPGSARYRRMHSRTRLRLPLMRHSSEQYRARSVAAANALPHSLHSVRTVLPASPPALAVQCLQQEWRPARPYCSKARPHSLHVPRSAIAPHIESCAIRLPGRGGAAAARAAA